jgi:hypothetical protein
VARRPRHDTRSRPGGAFARNRRLTRQTRSICISKAACSARLQTQGVLHKAPAAVDRGRPDQTGELPQ